MAFITVEVWGIYSNHSKNWPCSTRIKPCHDGWIKYRADSRFAPSQWETGLLCNDVSHWLGASLESALNYGSHRWDMGCLYFSNEHSPNWACFIRTEAHHDAWVNDGTEALFSSLVTSEPDSLSTNITLHHLTNVSNFHFNIFQSLWNLAGDPAVLFPRCLWN